MVQLGTIKIKTEKGVKPLPIFEPGDVKLSIVRIQTEKGVGALELIDPEKDTDSDGTKEVYTETDEVRIQTNNHGVKSVSQTKLKVDSSLNNQEAEITVFEDIDGDGNAERTDTVKVTDSGVFSYTLPNIRGDDSSSDSDPDYWLDIQLTNPNDITKSAEINSVELQV